MNKYEGIFIIKPELNEEASQKLLTDIQNHIAKDNGKVENVESWGKKKLMYPIGGRKEGLYYKIDFQVDSLKMEALNKTYRLFGDILRVMFIKK